MRYKFSDLFTVNNGMVQPKVSVHINGVTMGPGVSFGSGVSFGGVDLTQFIGKDFEADIQNNVYILKAVY